MGRFVQWGNFSFEQPRVCGQLELEPPSPFHYSLGRRLSLTLNYGEVGWGKTSTQIRERCCPNSYHGAIWLSWGIRHAHNIKNDLHLVLSVLRLKVDTDLFSFFCFCFYRTILFYLLIFYSVSLGKRFPLNTFDVQPFSCFPTPNGVLRTQRWTSPFLKTQKKSETRMTASVLRQNLNTWKFKNNANLIWEYKTCEFSW